MSLLPCAGINSFKAHQPASPSRGTSLERPAWFDELGGSGSRTDLDGVAIQGAAVLSHSRQQPTESQCPSKGQTPAPPVDPQLIPAQQIPAAQPSPDRRESGGLGMTSSPIKMQGLQVLLPSTGAANDVMRVRGLGRRLCPPIASLKQLSVDTQTAGQAQSSSSSWMKQSVSMPALSSTLHTVTSSSSENHFPVPNRLPNPAAASSHKRVGGFDLPASTILDLGRHTIGTSTPWVETDARPGVTRDLSYVALEYPGLYPAMRPSSRALKPVKHRVGKKPAFVDMKPVTYLSHRDAGDMAGLAAEKSRNLMNALSKLRRGGRDEDKDAKEPGPVHRGKEKQRGSPTKGRRAAMAAVVAQTFDFAYTYEEYAELHFKQRIEQELKERGLPVEELSRRATVMDKRSEVNIDMDAVLELSDMGKFPLQITVQVMPKLPPLPGEEPEENPADDAFKFEAPPEEEKDTTIMLSALGSTRDTYDELAVILKDLQDLQDPVAEMGGARHATAIGAWRTLEVVKRKVELLSVVEERKRVFKERMAAKEKHFKDVTTNAAPPPEGLLQVRQFVSDKAHKPDPLSKAENPAEADKSNFEYFASTFGIHKNHMHFQELMSLAADMVKWWAKEAMKLAEGGAESDEIKRHLDTVKAIGADKSAYDEVADDLASTQEILGDVLSKRALVLAEKLREKDRQIVERSKDAQPQSAKEKAAEVNEEILRAVNLGAPPKHENMTQAKAIATYLEAQEKERYALKAFLAASKIKERDAEEAASYLKKNGVPPVGPAAMYAEMVEGQIKDALKLGAPQAHEHIAASTAIAKELRDADGTRKREANRAKRLAAEAAAKNQ